MNLKDMKCFVSQKKWTGRVSVTMIAYKEEKMAM